MFNFFCSKFVLDIFFFEEVSLYEYTADICWSPYVCSATFGCRSGVSWLQGNRMYPLSPARGSERCVLLSHFLPFCSVEVEGKNNLFVGLMFYCKKLGEMYFFLCAIDSMHATDNFGNTLVDFCDFLSPIFFGLSVFPRQQHIPRVYQHICMRTYTN